MTHEINQRVPHWVLRPLPLGAACDKALEAKLTKLSQKMVANLHAIANELNRVQTFREYDSAANLANRCVWLSLNVLAKEQPSQLLAYARKHFPDRARRRVLRRLSKDSRFSVRRSVSKVIDREQIREVALPARRDGDWNASGWLRGLTPSESSPQRAGSRIQERFGLPPLETVGDIRELLDIRSPQQLGYFLLATDVNGGPYIKFKIPKRSGAEREICAPKGQLCFTQRQILRKILDKATVHDAAHGFVAGRSTVTNAAVHQGAAVILKFDLSDFFPTIHYNRVLGLFAKLGYEVDDRRFSNDDDSRRVAATLARLCTYTQDSQTFGAGFLPQGAPTSPAISNLICRGLDGRLTGLAQRMNGAYTRYADDLTFSFQVADLDLGRFRWWVDQICHQEGFFVNQSKFRVVRNSQRQMVTGIVVNEVLRVPRRERRRFRAMLHNCQQHGLESQQHGNPALASYLRGFASYLYMVHPEEGGPLLAEVNALLGSE